MGGKVKLSIIIVGLNTKEWLTVCLKSILANPPPFSFEIIYFDNGSSDGTLSSIKNFSKELRILGSAKNLGLAKANNLGSKQAKGQYLLFLNPDTEVIKGALGKMVNCLQQHQEIGILGPKLYNSRKLDLQRSCNGRLDPLTALFALSFLNKFFPKNPFSKRYFLSGWDRNSIKDVGAISGAAMLVKKDIFNQVGGFDERYFLYFEENDLCLAVEKMGKKIVYYPEAGIIHHLGKASVKNPSEARKHFYKSRYKFFQKHFGQPTAFVIHSFLRLFEALSEK